MARFKAGIITFPGSNCDRDMQLVLTNFFDAQADILWHGNAIKEKYDLLVLPGGFSYGDYLRAGALARFGPAMSSLHEHVATGGYVLGICNGFQILCEAKLLPGALIRNTNLKHIARSVDIQVAGSPFTVGLDRDRVYSIPVSHSEGNYRIDEDGLRELQDNDRIAFRYTDNPNGSVDDIAGISSASGRILGMMPHPERATDPVNGPNDGKAILASALDHVLMKV